MFDNLLDFNKIYEWYGYPRYLHKRLDIGHYRVYKLMTNTDVFHFIFSNGLNRNTHEFQKTDDKLCVLWEQLVKEWNDYEEFLDEELPVLKLEQNKKRKFL